jgi:DNA-binding winged helix-turn-helix (wHTH) protein
VARYRFSHFVLSPKRRALLANGTELPLIPRYFDLLLFLIEHRGEAVHRQQIFDAVWGDVAVSDAALSQAVRTIRRVLGDDSRDPRFVRTVSRHGYQFIFAGVVEEEDVASASSVPISNAPAGVPVPVQAIAAGAVPAQPDDADPFAALIDRIASSASSASEEEDQRDAAERLHELGTEEALRRLGTGVRTIRARALLRDARWNTPCAGAVPILGQPHAAAVVSHLVRLRLRQAARLAAARWAGAAVGAGIAGAIGGAVGGLLLVVAPGSAAPAAVVPVLSAIGLGCGAIAGAGVGAGLATAEAVMRSHRLLALCLGGAAGGGIVGTAIEWLGRWSLDVLVGIQAPIGGALEGLIIGGAAGLGYGAMTRSRHEGLPAPRGTRRIRLAIGTAAACAAAALVLSLANVPLVGGTIHGIAQASAGAQVVLTPLGHLIGEPGFGRATAALIGTGEGAAFGLGLALGLARRPVRTSG